MCLKGSCHHYMSSVIEFFTGTHSNMKSIWLYDKKKQNASDSNVIYLCLFSKRLSSGFSLVFSTTDNGPFQTSKAHLQLQAAGHSQLCHFLKHTVHHAYQKFSIEKLIM